LGHEATARPQYDHFQSYKSFYVTILA